MTGAADFRGRLSGWLLIGSGAVYFLFYGLQFLGVDLDGPQELAIFVHLILILLTLAGLIGARRALSLESWLGALWTMSTVLAVLGLTVGKPFWSAAMFGLGIVSMALWRAHVVASLLVIGGAIWLYLFAAGVRVGGENGRPMLGIEPDLALVAVVLMALGLVGLGRKVRGATSHLTAARQASR
ncbi:MAG TPA: hypothetical protein VFU96_04475 [Acidimicrobiia bacterium]|nr:hypothetical protein [Acidimicrobiia bacterium]